MDIAPEIHERTKEDNMTNQEVAPESTSERIVIETQKLDFFYNPEAHALKKCRYPDPIQKSDRLHRALRLWKIDFTPLF